MRSLGFDLGGTALKWVVLADGRVRDRGAADTPTGGADAVVETMAAVAAGVDRFDVVGVGVPGRVEPGGVTSLLHNVPGDWDGYPFAAVLRDAVEVPVRLVNDACAFTLAELRLGAGAGCEHLLAVTLGTGVGGGVVSNGRLHLGYRDRAGELGHQQVVADGPRCGCGAHGCVETIASAPAVVAAAARAVWQGVDTALVDACAGDPTRLDVPTIIAAARSGDAFALDVIERAARALGAGLANVVTVLAPERIVVGGGVAAALDVFLPTLETTIRSRARLTEPPTIVAAALGLHAGAIGAAVWAEEGAPR